MPTIRFEIVCWDKSKMARLHERYPVTPMRYLTEFHKRYPDAPKTEARGWDTLNTTLVCTMDNNRDAALLFLKHHADEFPALEIEKDVEAVRWDFGQARIAASLQETIPTLQQWANRNSFNILKIKGRRAWVDKVPSQWFAPQWIDIPEYVGFTEEQANAYN